MQFEAQTKKNIQNKINLRVLSAFILVLFFIFISFNTALAATLSISPSSGAYTVGKTFTATVYVGSPDQAINAVSGILSFPADKLEATAVSKSGSVITLWVQEPAINNSTGKVSFEGIAFNPGYTGKAGKVISVTFRAKSGGSAPVTFSSGSILANDGQGTNILNGMGSARYNIEVAVSGPAAPKAETPPESVGTPAAPQISSDTHPDPEAWYNVKNANFAWSLGSDITGVRLLVSDKPQDTPTVDYKPPISSKMVSNLDDGIWYAHVRLENKQGWGGVSHFRLQIDTQKPDKFEISSIEKNEVSDPSNKFIFTASDSGSGISHYNIKIDDQDLGRWEDKGDHIYVTPNLKAGNHTLRAEVFDKAGNSLTSFLDFEIKPLAPPIITYYANELQSQDVMVIKGDTYPTSQVFIWLQKDNGQAKSYTVQSDELGKFVFIYDEKLSDGIYTFWAESQDKRGATSSATEKKNIFVQPPKFLRIGNLAISFLSVVIPIIALIILLVLMLSYSWFRIRRLRKQVIKEVGEAELMLHGEIGRIKQNIIEQIKILEQASAIRQLTKEEKMLIDNLSKNLDEAELKIFKEIEDIDVVAGDKATKKRRKLNKK